MIRLTVVIPTFNRRELTFRAVSSALDNECSRRGEVEVVVADDGSTDGTAEFLNEAFRSNACVRILSGPRVCDPSVGRNKGVEAARGEWVALLDSDDYWRPGRLDRVWPYLDQFDLVCEAFDPKLVRHADFLRNLLEINFAPMSSYIIRTRLLKSVGGFPTGFYGSQRRWDRGWEDYEVAIHCVCSLSLGHTARVKVMPDSDVVIEHQVGGVGRVQIREQMRREFWSLLRTFSGLPLRLKGLALRRMLGAIRALLR